MFNKTHTINNIRKNIVGIKNKVTLISGENQQYINLDNAASTPSLKPVLNKINEFSEYYSSIHRGVGIKSLISTEVYELARRKTLEFVNADEKIYTSIFVKNTTEAINKLSYRLNLSKNDIVLVSLMEHHSNDLPWRNRGKRVYINLLDNNRLDINDLEYKLKRYRDKVKLVSITGASNVTGYINDIHKIASLVHKYNTKLMVDCAQLIPHRKVNISGNGKDDYIDFIAFSSHKMYAPFGSGVLIGLKDTFSSGTPEYVGGGNIISVSKLNEYWSAPPEKEEAGTPNIIGSLALMESIKILEEIDMDNIKKHEGELTNKLIEHLKQYKNINLYTDTTGINTNNHLGVISFNFNHIPHNLLSSLLAFEGGIGVRSGCFCAHPYIHKLLNLSNNEIRELQKKLLFEGSKNSPGLIRVSFGMYNNFKEIDLFIKTLDNVLNNLDTIKNNYTYNDVHDCYLPKNFELKSLNDYI